MKCKSLFLLLVALCVATSVSAQKVSLNFKKVPLDEVLTEITKQTNFTFAYSQPVIDPKTEVSIEVKNVELQQALDKLLAGTGIVYEISNKKVLLFSGQSPERPGGTSYIMISGFVTDAMGALAGASVKVKGTNKVVVTDVNGRFSLEADAQGVLEVSFMGYSTKEVPIAGRAQFEINLKEDAQTLDEVVVVGYGTQRKVSVVAAITTIEPAKLKTSTTRSLSNNLVGNLGGIIGVQRSGEPGYDNSNFWIRGISTFGSNTNPLVLIDGIERSLNNIDIQEIETLSVLKDAAASAVYGVRGANGVILINTKRGRIGKPTVNISVEHAITQPVQLPEFLNAADYLTLMNNIQMQENGTYFRSPDVIEKYRTGYDPELYPDVNWMNAITKDFASNTRTTLDINGGSEKLRYSFIFAHFNEQGIIERDERQEWNSSLRGNRFNMRSNVDVNVTPTTLLRFNIGGYLQNRVSPPQSIDNLFGYAFITPPFVHPPQYSTGEIPLVHESVNPWARATQTGYENNTQSKIESVFSVEQDIPFIKGLKAKAIFSFDNYSSTNLTRSKTPDYYLPASGRDPETGKLNLTISAYGQEFLGHSISGEYGENSVYFETDLVYDRTFGDHAVSALLLYNQKNFDKGEKVAFRTQGLAGRLSYTYGGRYVTEFNFGYNGSENFAKGQRFGFFPSIAAGYVLSEEPFMAPFKKTFSKIKFRASYGLAGNDVLGDDPDNPHRFAYITTIAETGGYKWGTSGAEYNRTGRREGDVGVEDLTWETVAKTNLGLELELWKALELQVDVFKEQRRDIFMQRNNFPNSAGFSSLPYANFGKVDNQGVEATLIFNKPIGNNWLITARATATYAVNKVIERDEALGVQGSTRSEIGKPVNQLFGLVADGLFTENDFADLTTGELKAGIPIHKFSARVFPGDIKYVDMDGDGVITDLDETAIGGTTDPQFVYGFAASINYKQFDLAFFFQGNALTDRIIGRSYLFIPGANAGATGNIYSNAYDAWTEENPSQDVFYPRLHYGRNENNLQASTWWLNDMSMLRLKNLEVGYTLPQKWMNAVWVSRARIYLRGANLLCFSKFKLWDPEINSPNNGGLRYPIMRSFSIGLDVTFK
jgi:TonB-linked SusC/RagA family outer membrane protein